MNIAASVTALIGNTPLLALSRIEDTRALRAHLLAKPEAFNPAGSAKDRVALSMIEDLEARGMLAPGGVIIEPTSGNTGIALASIGASRGYRVIIVMPDSMSQERRMLISAYGAELVLTPGDEGMAGAIRRAEELKNEIPGAVILGQFDNAANPAAHYNTTGPEIWRDTDGCVDIFVAGVGTGGTLTGVGRYLKEKNPDVKVVAVEPADSPLLSGGASGAHGLQGIGANFIPSVLDVSLIDEIICVSTDEAYAGARLMATKEGVLVGISSGAALHAAMMLAAKEENEGKNIVVLLPDSGERYLSTALFS